MRYFPFVAILFFGCAHAPVRVIPTQDIHINAAISDSDRIDGKAVVVEKYLMSTK